MERHKHTAFLKFFITYFVSVGALILVAGFFYFTQMSKHFLKNEEFFLIKYARHIKMGDTIDDFTKDYHYEYLELNKPLDITNFTVSESQFSKHIPMQHGAYYLKVYKSKKSFDKEVWSLKKMILSVQLLLLLFFAYTSYRLAKSALKPLQESLVTLDKFAKDLIHDLNTPVTSIKLNMKLLEKIPQLKNNTAMRRLNKSVYTISELHENLTILLEEETFQMQMLNLCEIVDDVVQTQKQIYPNIEFITEPCNLKVKLNENAIKQILQNIISNACKYNSKHGRVNIYSTENALHIEDNGYGIKEPDRIFERSFSGGNSSGIGLDIVKRLAKSMDIEVAVHSSKDGSCFTLNFKS